MPQTKEPTDEQKLIIKDDGNVVVTAKPGSGKTFTIVDRLFGFNSENRLHSFFRCSIGIFDVITLGTN